MSQPDSSADPFGHVADEFMKEYRQGKEPQLEDYAARYPDCAEQIYDLLPMLMVMEKVNDFEKSTSGDRFADDAEPMIGREIGDYRVIREIGRGGMGVVYEAEQISLGRHVALKLLPGPARIDAKQVTRFEQEARAAARLHHTNIVPVFAVGEANGVWYYAMQFINGLGLDEILDQLRRINLQETPPEGDGSAVGSSRDVVQLTPPSSIVRSASSLSRPSSRDATRLSQAMSLETRELTIDLLNEPSASSSSSGSQRARSDSSTRSLSSASEYWRNIARIGVQVAEALAYAHEQGVIHRDIKPSNLLLDVHNIVWVTDFGLAKSEENKSLTLSGDILGTIRYMPPEAFSGQYDQRSDLYSLGVTLYELLTLTPAFSSSDRRELIRLVTQTRPVSLRKLRSNIPRDLAIVVHKSMEADAADRYHSAQKLADDLRRFLADEPILARKTHYIERFRRWSRRNKGLAASLAGIVCLLTIIAVGGVSSAIYFRQQEEVTNRLAQRNLALLEKNRSSLTEAIESAKQLDEARLLAVDKGEDVRRNLYYSHMANALQAISGHRGLGRALSLLERWRPSEPSENDLRDWEWYYINGLCHQNLATLEGHPYRVYSVAFSHDDQFLASVGDDGQLCLWDLETQTLVQQIGDLTGIHSVAWHPHDDFLAVGTNRGVIVWDTQTWEIVYRDKQSRTIFAVEWNPDGNRLAFAVKERTGQGRLPASVELTNVATWEIEATLPSTVLGFYTTSISFSPDGRLLAYPAGSTVRIWDLQENALRTTLSAHTGTVQSVAFHPHRPGVIASAGRDARTLVWNLDDGEILAELNEHTHAVSTLAWHPQDPTRLATASWDGTLRIWDVEQQRTLFSYAGHRQHVFQIKWNQAGNQIASSGDDGSVKLWSDRGPRDRHTIQASQRNIVTLAFSPDNKRLACGDGDSQVCLINAETLEIVWQQRHGNTTVRSVVFTPDGDSLVSVANGGGIMRWSIADPRTPVRKVSALKNIRTADVSPDGNLLALGGQSNVEIWDADLLSPEPMHSVLTPFDVVGRIRFSPDSRYIGILGNRNMLMIYDTLEHKSRVEEKDTSNFATLAWSHDGTRLVTSSGDHQIQIWDVASLQVKTKYVGHFDLIPALAWSPNERRILSADARGTVKLWDPRGGQETITLQTTIGELRGACWSPDGKRVAGAADGVITIWDASQGYEAEALRILKK